ncbi:transglycosylase domain-containing protein [Magnetospirillum sp. UT-4]|uniref:transglycosylase domain-containing protein n=1 Tax=Magnetospirillum sp. UT-4 TaxID=2681467 RepID=UPI001574B661|nr:PBP1A family penicillin-binding protein [Magnetospirillum sp. UT-4]
MPTTTPPSRGSRAALSLEIDPADRLLPSGGGGGGNGRTGGGGRKGGGDGPGDGPPRRQPRPRRERKPRGGGGWGRRLLVWSLTALIWAGVLLGALIAYYAVDLPDIDKVTAATRRPSVQFVSVDGETFAAYGDLYGQPLELAEMAPTVVQAVLATEDRRFRSHFGLDMFGLARAAFANLRAGRVVQGGSTITQQLAKNLFLTPDRTLKRKVQELLMALWLEQRFDKDQILTLYLNRVYLGSGTFGVDAAAKRYFDVPAGRLGLYQSAVIAGLLKAPSRYSPLNNPEASHRRTVEVLGNMVEAGYLDAKSAELAALSGAAQAVRRPLPAGRYFADWVMAHLDGMGEVQGRDIVVRTTLDIGLQRKVEAELKAMLDGAGAKAGAGQGAVVVMSPDGAVRALTGGKDYDDSQFNRATQGLRQPGSAFKPFVYLAAMELGFRPHDVFDDAPIKLGNWKPGNYNGRFEGPVSLRHAFAQSTNTVAVRLIEEVGPSRVIALAKRMGIQSELRTDASLALGTSETTLLDLTTAFAAFANGGFGIGAYGVDSITDPDGHVLWSRQGGGFGQVVQGEPLASMHELMAAVIAEGTGKAARLDRPAAGKTGTTQDYRDAWFMGFTADYVAGVWLGNDDQRHAMKKVTGGGLPARLWKSVMLAAHRGLPARPLLTPEPPPVAEGTEGTAGDWPEASAEGNPVHAIGDAIDGLLNSLFGR